MATFQGFTFNMQTGAVTASRAERPELHMELDEIAREKARSRRAQRSAAAPVKKSVSAQKSVNAQKSVSAQKAAKRKKQYDIKVPEAALRELLADIGIKTDGYTVRLVAEQK